MAKETMQRLVIRTDQRRDSVLLTAVVPLLPLAIPLVVFQKWHWVGALAACTWLVVVGWLVIWKALSRDRFIVDSRTREITRITLTFPGLRTRRTTFRFADFHCVRSNLAHLDQSSINEVELMRIEDGRRLVLATFDPARGGTVVGDSTFAEAPQAAALRQSVAALMGVRDWGYKESWGRPDEIR